MITFQSEPFMRNKQQLRPMLEKHYAELALDKEKVPLAVDWDVYAAREDAGQMLFVTVREDGILMGYFVGFVSPGLHYKTCLTLQMDVFWIDPELRDGDSLSQVEAAMIGEDLFREVFAQAKRRGVQRAFMGSKLHKDASALFERMDGVEVERYFSFWLGD